MNDINEWFPLLTDEEFRRSREIGRSQAKESIRELRRDMDDWLQKMAEVLEKHNLQMKAWRKHWRRKINKGGVIAENHRREELEKLRAEKHHGVTLLAGAVDKAENLSSRRGFSPE